MIDLEARAEAIIAMPEAMLAANTAAYADELLAIGEEILERWLLARDAAPTRQRREGFRLLALHRQGAGLDPSFNACRETCRELVYRYNVVRLDPRHPETAHRLRLDAMVARHLALFVGGKLEVARLGEFCCSSRPLREGDSLAAVTPRG
jgi:hypothetical protein